MLKFDIIELYKTLLKTLKKVYIGNLYIIIESIEFNLNDQEEDTVLALDPWGYTIKGRYGREDEENPMHERFCLNLNIEDSTGVIEGKFEDFLFNS